MTQDEIIEMARQTGWHDALLDVSFVLPTLTDFAKLVAAKAIAELESQEPDYWLGYGLQAYTEKPFKNATGLYTHPPQHTWVGLTDEERSQLVTLHHGWNEYAQAIEAKLKEKNCVG